MRCRTPSPRPAHLCLLFVVSILLLLSRQHTCSAMSIRACSPALCEFLHSRTRTLPKNHPDTCLERAVQKCCPVRGLLVVCRALTRSDSEVEGSLPSRAQA